MKSSLKEIESDSLIREHSYLVSRGVRLLAIIGQCEADSLTMLKVATRIETLADYNVIPFVIDRGNGNAEYGYAAAGWVLDLFKWVGGDNGIPEKHRNHIIGLLCGYGVEAIRLFEEQRRGRLFHSPISASP